MGNERDQNAWTVFWIYFLAMFLGSFSAQSAFSADVDKILVVKHERKLHLLKNEQIIKTYSISLGRAPEGKKQASGDQKTPEGQYQITEHNPQSAYSYSLRISYPNKSEIEYARTHGFDPGGDIMIHGLPNGLGWIGRWHLMFDWTQGCIALTNEEIGEVAQVVREGTPIEIRP